MKKNYLLGWCLNSKVDKNENNDYYDLNKKKK